MSESHIEMPADRPAARASVRSGLAAAMTLALAQLAQPAAAAPVTFDGWSVSNGTIDTTTSCSATGVTCTTLVQDDGFLQQEVTTPEGRYYRTIITDTGATGAPADLGFTEENFIPVNGTLGTQISDKQAIRDSGSNFNSVSHIERAPVLDNDGNLIDMFSMQVSQTMNEGPFSNEFELAQYSAEGHPTLGPVSGRSLDINQAMVFSDDEDPFVHMQEFDHRQRSGWKPELVEGVLTVAPVTPAGSMDLSHGDLIWNEGDPVTSTWFAQVDESEETGNFSYQKVGRTDPDTDAKTSTSLMLLDPPAPIDPFDWDADTFGTAPSAP